MVATLGATLASRGRRVLMVDADSPAFGLADFFSEATSSGSSQGICVAPVHERLSVACVDAAAARCRIEDIIAAKRWQRLAEQAGGSRLASVLGAPLSEVVELVDLLAKPPPGIETMVSLATLLSNDEFRSFDHIIVDAGAASQMDDLTRVPRAVADLLAAVVRMELLLKAFKLPTDVLPLPFRAPLKLFPLPPVKQASGWRRQLEESVRSVAELETAMVILAQDVEGASRLLCACDSASKAATQKLHAHFQPHGTIFTKEVDSWSHGPFACLPSLCHEVQDLAASEELEKLLSNVLRF